MVITQLNNQVCFLYVVSPPVTAEACQYVLLGNNATLRCNIIGDPEPVVLWRRNRAITDSDENTYRKPMPSLT